MFRDLSIKRKLTFIITFTSSVALLLGVAAYVAYDVFSLRQAMVRDLATLSEIIAANSTASLAFDDAGSAAEILSSLSAKPTIERAILYSRDGAVFAEYGRADGGAGSSANASASPPAPGPDGHAFASDALVLNTPVNLDGERIGTITIRSDLRELDSRARQYIFVGVALLLAVTCVAFLLSSRFQRIVSDPILDLARVTRGIAEQKDYSMRAPKRGNDEIGMLVDDFNHMLAEISRRTAALAEANAQLENSERLALAANQAKSTFLANMSHELRTPLNAIIGYSELLEEEAEDAGQPEFIPDLRKINSAGKHLLALINGVLDLSKIEAGKVELYLEAFDIRAMVSDVTATIKPLVEKNANTLVVDTAGAPGAMRADLTKVRQVLFNLLSNAAKFTEKGTITLRVSRERSETGDEILFAVADSGIGMTPEQIGRIFEAFSQADASTTRKYGGTGLGLAISRRFCRMMGGDITVESAPGAGTQFTARVPVEVVKEGERPANDHLPAAPSEPRDESGRRLVLVIDDDPAAHDLMQHFLTKENLSMVSARSGAEGLRLAKSRRPDLITLDVMMPGMDGWAVLTGLKADPETADIPVIMLTVVDDKNMGYALGATDYMTKPIDWTRFAEVVGRYRCAHPPCPVLVVDDEAAMRELLRRALQSEGWAVAEAADGRAALARVAENRPALILLDLMMPNMDGFEFLAHLRKESGWRSIPVIVITAKELAADDRARLEGSVKQIIAKGSYDREELLRQIREFVSRPRAT
ncbi:MAG: response regulator [bacterium]